ncbi:MAG: PDZ domain-containing protein [Eggerthellaceae bacterium]|nr:PDZ domain-containing protein [Eggerthellaceae bacterium]
MSERGKGKNQRVAARTQKIRARNSRLIQIFVVVILACAMFAAGFLVRDHPYFLQRLGFPDTVTGLATNIADQNDTKDVHNSLSMRVGEVEDKLKNDSLDEYDLDEVTVKTLEAFAGATYDPYLRYYTAERYRELLNQVGEGYAGIGVLFSEYNGMAYVVDVFDGSEAQLAGIQEGDFVESINGDNSQGWSRAEVAAKLSQSKGSTVVITWRRPESLEADGGETFTTTLLCAEYDQTNVDTEYDEDRRVGYIKVRQFTQNSASLVQTAITELTAQGAGAFVLDVRDNPGGYLSQAVDTASLFMSSGTVVEIQTVDGTITKNASSQTATALPLVVITNKNSAAGAEILAAALKESQRATVIGTTTMGKGSVQTISVLSFGGALRYTAAYYKTPEGRDIDRVGVAPDVTVEMTDEGDAQKDYALGVATSLVRE